MWRQITPAFHKLGPNFHFEGKSRRKLRVKERNTPDLNKFQTEDMTQLSI